MIMKQTLKCFTAIASTVMLITALCACSDGGQNEPLATQSPSPAQAVTTGASPDTTAAPAQHPDMTTVPPTEPRQDSPAEPDPPVIVSGEVVITFDYVRQSGSASNQFAVWIENMNGDIVKNIYATQWTANGGYRTRPDSIAIWAERSGLASMQNSEVDAVSGATPRTDTLTYIWDLTGVDGETVPSGNYMFFVEGTLRWKNFVLYSGVIEISDRPITVQANAEFTYESSDRYGALTAESPENDMIHAVTASFEPASGN